MVLQSIKHYLTTGQIFITFISALLCWDALIAMFAKNLNVSTESKLITVD